MSAQDYPQVTWLTPTGGWPSFSSDGRTVVYTLSNSLLTIPAAGGKPKTIVSATKRFSASRPDWSWRKTLIAFTGQEKTSDGRVVAHIWLVNRDGTNLHRMAGQGQLSDTFYPSWYKNPRYIAAMDGGGNQHVVIYKFDRGGGDPTALTSYDAVTAGRPSVSPDGASVAFAGTKGPFDQQNNQIWKVTPPSQQAVQLDRKQGRSPNWSPDGRWILFESNRDGGNYRLYVMPAGGGAVAALTDGTVNATHGEWSRQQDKIVFQGSGKGIGVFNVPAKYRA